ncbi:MAG: DNA-formamidopyrimidine glycosylase family protein [candidate division WOR-3 bacterium]
MPEVQTIATILRQGSREQPSLLGKQIVAARVFWERSLAQPEAAEFARRIVGQRVEDVTRRGTFIVITLSNDYLLFHLRMSGDLMVEREAAPMLPHHRLALLLEGGWRLAFNDPRKFGRAWLVRDAQLVLSELGPEPLDEQLTPNELFDRLQKRRRRLKPLLMDQSFLAGIGNIYADEILHAARLHPLRLSDSLTYTEAERLLFRKNLYLSRSGIANGLHAFVLEKQGKSSSAMKYWLTCFGKLPLGVDIESMRKFIEIFVDKLEATQPMRSQE